MKNKEVLSQKIDNAIRYLSEQEVKLLPVYERLQELLIKKVKEEDIPFPLVLEAYCKLQEQYTNSTLLLTKLKEIIDFKDFD